MTGGHAATAFRNSTAVERTTGGVPGPLGSLQALSQEGPATPG